MEKTTIVTRERVIASPERYISIPDSELLARLRQTLPTANQSDKSKNSSSINQELCKLQEMLEALCTTEFQGLARSLEKDFTFFSRAAAGTPNNNDPKELDPTSFEDELNAQESNFLLNLVQLLETSQYKMLRDVEWDAALAEEFLLTLPVAVNWEAMDASVLPRALWSRTQHHLLRSQAPPQLADRILIFHRGIDVAHIQGHFWSQKVDLLLSFFIIQPLFNFLCWLMHKVGIGHFWGRVENGAPNLYHNHDLQSCHEVSGPPAKAAAAATTISPSFLHQAAINVERKTFARAYPTGMDVLKKFFKKAKLQEACFKDVIVLYRKSINKSSDTPDEAELLRDTPVDQNFLKRNFHIKKFSSIPIADIELVFPEKNVYMPPQIFVQIAVTVAGAFVAVLSSLWGGASRSVMWSLLTMLGSRAMQVYTTATVQKTRVERVLQKLLYERTMASQEAVLHCLMEERIHQLSRMLFVCYSVALMANRPFDLDELDTECERLLSQRFGLEIDFQAETAVEKLSQWGIVSVKEARGSKEIQAVPIAMALQKLAAVWSAVYSGPYSDGGPSSGSLPNRSSPPAPPPPIPSGSQEQKQQQQQQSKPKPTKRRGIFSRMTRVEF